METTSLREQLLDRVDAITAGLRVTDRWVSLHCRVRHDAVWNMRRGLNPSLASYERLLSGVASLELALHERHAQQRAA